jgi:hypothetical protein
MAAVFSCVTSEAVMDIIEFNYRKPSEFKVGDRVADLIGDHGTIVKTGVKLPGLPLIEVLRDRDENGDTHLYPAKFLTKI